MRREKPHEIADRIIGGEAAEMREAIIRAVKNERRVATDRLFRDWMLGSFARGLIRARRAAESKLAFALKQGKHESRRRAT